MKTLLMAWGTPSVEVVAFSRKSLRTIGGNPSSGPLWNHVLVQKCMLGNILQSVWWTSSYHVYVSKTVQLMQLLCWALSRPYSANVKGLFWCAFWSSILIAFFRPGGWGLFGNRMEVAKDRFTTMVNTDSSRSPWKTNQPFWKWLFHLSRK